MLTRVRFLAGSLIAGCSSALPQSPVLPTAENMHPSSNTSYSYTLLGNNGVEFFRGGVKRATCRVTLNDLRQLVFYEWRASTGTTTSLNIMQVHGSQPILYNGFKIVPIDRGAILEQKDGTKLYTIKFLSSGRVSVVNDRQPSDNALSAGLVLAPNIGDDCLKDWITLAGGFALCVIGGLTSEALVGVGIFVGGLTTMLTTAISMKTDCNK